MNMGQRISTAADFSRVVVYRRDSTDGPVMSVAFRNLEYLDRLLPGKDWVANLPAYVILVVLLLGFPAILIFGMAAGSELGRGGGFAAFVLILGGYTYLFIRFKNPRTLDRVIELDFGADALRVLLRGKPVVRQQLSRLANLTVEDHPDAELARLDRQMKGEKKPRNAEKQHCLIGWFGAGGSEQVMLITRAEFPNRNSLFEVRQAMLWAMEQGGNAAMANETQAAPRTGGGVKPPLD